MSNSEFDDEFEPQEDAAIATGVVDESDLTDEIGKTSKEASDSDKYSDLSFGARVRRMEFSLYDAVLLVSLLFVALATLLLFWELRDFGPFPFSYPWRTSES